jgi:hypothetical protein
VLLCYKGFERIAFRSFCVSPFLFLIVKPFLLFGKGLVMSVGDLVPV